jgi:2-(3-amino-3-carboxypropyl)histidine synthase
MNMLEKVLPQLKDFGTIGIVVTIQQVHQLSEIKEFFEKNGKKVVIGKPYGFAKKPGQILGCDIGSAASIDRDVDAFVYFGGGIFHPLGAALATTKPFFAIDPFNGKIESMDSYREKHAKRSRGKVLAALKSRRFGILVSTKNGQHNMALGKVLKRKIEDAGLDAQILVSNTFDFESLNNMREFDAFVNTACPRIAIDDIDRTAAPLLSANELMEVIRMKGELKEVPGY